MSVSLATLQSLTLGLSAVFLVISFIITVWSLYYNYKQAKVYNQIKEMIDILKEIRDQGIER